MRFDFATPVLDVYGQPCPVPIGKDAADKPVYAAATMALLAVTGLTRPHAGEKLDALTQCRRAELAQRIAVAAAPVEIEPKEIGDIETCVARLNMPVFLWRLTEFLKTPLAETPAPKAATPRRKPAR